MIPGKAIDLSCMLKICLKTHLLLLANIVTTLCRQPCNILVISYCISLLEQPCNKSDNTIKLVTSCQQFVPNLLQQLGTSSANTTCRQLVNRFVTTCLQTCNNLCVFTCVEQVVNNLVTVLFSCNNPATTLLTTNCSLGVIIQPYSNLSISTENRFLVFTNTYIKHSVIR